MRTSEIKVKIFFITLFLVSVIMCSVSAATLTGTGYGDTITDAKAFALQDLISGISVDVYSNVFTKDMDGSGGGYSTFDKSVSVSSNITLQSVRYDVRKCSTAEEKKLGKYVCIASISDEDKEACISQAERLVSEINTLWVVAMTDTDKRAVVAAFNLLEEKLKSWESCFLTASLLGYLNDIPSLDSDINMVTVEIEKKKAEAVLTSAAMLGEVSSSDTQDLQNMLIDSLWQSNQSEFSSSSSSVNVNASDGIYSREWKIGGAGPAGGIIVYDKGYASDGWRYLEMATEDLPGTYTGVRIVTNTTSSEIGAGKENTEILLANAKSLSGSAVIACAEYERGGFNDWYLPAKGEWDVIYQTMYGVKALKTDKNPYWSSTMMSSTSMYGFSYKSKKIFSDSYSKKYKVRPIRQF